MATYGTPACLPTLAQLKSDPSFMTRMASQTALNTVPDFDMQQSGNSYQVPAYLAALSDLTACELNDQLCFLTPFMHKETARLFM